MTEFIPSPMFDRWLVRNPPRHSLLLCAPFLLGGTLERVLAFTGLPGRGGPALKVLFRGLRRDFLQGASDLAAVELLARLEAESGGRAEVRLLDNLHMKAYLADGTRLLVTSGNCTRRGFEASGPGANVEGGIATDEPAVTAAFLDSFRPVWEAAAPLGERLEALRDPAFREQVLAQMHVRRRQEAGPAAGGRRYAVPAAPPPVREAPAGARGEKAWYIPQNYRPEALEETLRFLSARQDAPELRTKTELARVLGSRAVEKESRDRKLNGLLKNLRLLGLTEDRDCRGDRLPPLTPLGLRCAACTGEARRRLLGQQVMLLPWFSEVMELELRGRTADQALLDYLCAPPYCYEQSTARRYVPAMKHLLDICDLTEQEESHAQ